MTPTLRFATLVLPKRLAIAPEETWKALSGGGWRDWLASIEAELGASLAGIEVDTSDGGPVVHRPGYELVAIRFPAPHDVDEPHWVIVSRRRDLVVQCFVFHRGAPSPERPVHVQMTEHLFEGQGRYRSREFGETSADASRLVCISRTVQRQELQELVLPPMTSAQPGRLSIDLANARRPAPPAASSPSPSTGMSAREKRALRVALVVFFVLVVAVLLQRR